MEDLKQDNAIVPQESDVIKDNIKQGYENILAECKNDSEFQKRLREVVGLATATALRADFLKALNEEQKNELLQYEMDCEKEKLAYRKKHEKKIIYEEAKAEVQEKKINALKKRYAYLYELDENGQPKKFIASKFVNKYKEFCNWYDGTSQGFKKIITSTLRIVFFALIAYLVYTGLVWVNENLPELLSKNLVALVHSTI